jgi:hypothetical protein
MMSSLILLFLLFLLLLLLLLLPLALLLCDHTTKGRPRDMIIHSTALGHQEFLVRDNHGQFVPVPAVTYPNSEVQPMYSSTMIRRPFITSHTGCGSVGDDNEEGDK